MGDAYAEGATCWEGLLNLPSYLIFSAISPLFHPRCNSTGSHTRYFAATAERTCFTHHCDRGFFLNLEPTENFGIGWWLLLGSWWPSLGKIPTNWRLCPLKIERYPTSKNEWPISLNSKFFFCKGGPHFSSQDFMARKHPRNTGFPPKALFFEAKQTSPFPSIPSNLRGSLQWIWSPKIWHYKSHQ